MRLCRWLARRWNVLDEAKLFGRLVWRLLVGGGVAFVVVLSLHCKGVPGSGSWSAQAESHTQTLVCAAWLVSCNEDSERGCPVRCCSQIRSLVVIQFFGPGVIVCIAVFFQDVLHKITEAKGGPFRMLFIITQPNFS